MTPPYPVRLYLQDPRGMYYAITGLVIKDHGPAHEFRWEMTIDRLAQARFGTAGMQG